MAIQNKAQSKTILADYLLADFKINSFYQDKKSRSNFDVSVLISDDNGRLFMYFLFFYLVPCMCVFFSFNLLKPLLTITYVNIITLHEKRLSSMSS